ncbi:MAG: YdcF family protein [Erysipelotrichaceae bacterium]|nr:YdcF family protein [Erysipelotrichaceae bacterium]
MRTLLVLGNKLEDNQLSEALIARLETCISMYQVGDRIVVSGGVLPPNTISEALVMRNYLVDKGIDVNCIIMEDMSLDTIENLVNSREYLVGDIHIITSDYHVKRVLYLCECMGIKAIGVGVKTKFKLSHGLLELVGYYRIWRWRKS